MGRPEETGTTYEMGLTRTNDDIDLKDASDHVEEVVISRLTEDDVNRLSQQSFSMHSRAGFRICMIMFVQGCNQAGYGIDCKYS